MGTVINCANEFTIRQRVNQVRRIIAEKGWSNRVVITIQPDPTVDTGYGIVVWDKQGGKLEVNMDLFKAPH